MASFAISGCSTDSADQHAQTEQTGLTSNQEADIAAQPKYNFNTGSAVSTEPVQKETLISAATAEEEKIEQKQISLETLKNIKDAPELDSYLLQIGDTMDIKLRLNPELNEAIIIPPDGLISTTMAEDVQAYGRTIKELRTDLTKQYEKELSDPKISIILRSFAPNRVYVAGEVNSPGEFVTAGPNLTLMQAIARAGGLKNSASPSGIIVIRHKNGALPTAYTTDYKAAESGLDPASDAHLAAYDVVFVPRSDIADVYVYFQQFVQQFLPPSFGMSYQLNPQNNLNR